MKKSKKTFYIISIIVCALLALLCLYEVIMEGLVKNRDCLIWIILLIINILLIVVNCMDIKK